MREVDNAIGSFMTKLEGSGLSEITNVVIISDHGMKSDVGRRRVNLYDYINEGY